MKLTNQKKFARCGVMVTAAMVGMFIAGLHYVQADTGRGSIRAADRHDDHAAPPAHVEQHVEQHVDPRAQQRVDVHADAHRDDHPAPPPVTVQRDAHVEEHAPPRVNVEVRHDWDDHDGDPGHWGDFGHGVPVHIVRGQRFHALPAVHFNVVFNNVSYFCDDVGAYYVAQPDGEYLCVQPPVGVVVPALPAGVSAIVAGPTTYFYLDGEFYVAQNNGFAVVNPPPGIVVTALPTGAEQIVVNNVVMYQFNGFNYVPSIQDGVTMYTVSPA